MDLQKGKPIGRDRIAKWIDIETLKNKHVCLVGCGAAANLARNLVRNGVGEITLIDPDEVGEENLCRQEFISGHVGHPKVDALEDELRWIDPGVRVETFQESFCDFTNHDFQTMFAGRSVRLATHEVILSPVDLYIFCVDNLEANARGNEVALMTGTPAVWSGLYPGGVGWEVLFWKHGLPCYRCHCAPRYGARKEATAPPSDGADILTVQSLDSMTATIAIGLLTEGADNYYGRVIQTLGDRNYIQATRNWTWDGRDIVREQLGIAPDCDRYFGFCAMARRDPNPGVPPCPDCLRFGNRLSALGHMAKSLE